MANSPSGESIIQRVSRILHAFDDDFSLSVAELGRRANLPSTTAHRLVDELVSVGMLDRVGTEIVLGLRLWRLTEDGSRLHMLREAAEPHLRAFGAQLDLHVFLAVIDHHDVLYVAHVPGTIPVRDAGRTFPRLPAHAVSAGHVLMAHSPVDVQEAFLQQRLTRVAPSTVTNPRQLRHQFTTVRRDGFAVHVHPAIAPARGISVPVRGPDGAVAAAMGVVHPDPEADLQQLLLPMQSVAADITRELIQMVPAIGRRSI